MKRSRFLTLIASHQGAAPVVPWYLAGGVSLTNLGALYVPKNAASQSASYARVAGDVGNATLDPATVGGTAPAWDATGWTFNGSSHYLKTGIVAEASCSAMIFFTFIGHSDTYPYLFGSIVNAGSTGFAVSCHETSATVCVYFSGNPGTAAPILNSGCLGISGLQGYRNGVADGAEIAAGGALTAVEMYIGGVNQVGLGLRNKTNFTCAAIAYYKPPALTAAQMLAIYNAWTALP